MNPIDLLLALALAVQAPKLPSPSILCPAYPGDPPWRPITCYVLTHMGEFPDRPEL